MTHHQATDPVTTTTIRHRVNYSEIDQQGVVYHARYLIWLDIARTEHLRQTVMPYRELEAQGLQLVVSAASLRYRHPAQYDDPVRVRTWVRELATRRISFGYIVEHDESGTVLVTATTDLLILDRSRRVARFPSTIRERLTPIPDPVRLT